MDGVPGVDIEGWYERGHYSFKAPPVCSVRWTTQDWKRHVTPHSAAPFPLDPMFFGSTRMFHFGNDAAGKPLYCAESSLLAQIPLGAI